MAQRFRGPSSRSQSQTNLAHVATDVDPNEVFELVERIGRGSYGEVFRAYFKADRRVVAVKQIGLRASDGGLASVRKEIDFLQKCAHKNVVQYFGSYLVSDQLWIAMEYCGAGSVRDLCQLIDGPLTEPQIAYVTRETAQGLAYLHSINKLHRDIKSGNILVTDSGDIKLADFGVSAELDGTMRKRNTFVGTPYWMSPEVIQESDYDGKADVWSLGITTIEMAEQYPPNANTHPMRVLFKILQDPPPKLRHQHKWSQAFHSFLSYCLVKNAQSRPTSVMILKHPFLLNAGGRETLKETLERAKQLVQNRGYTAPSAAAAAMNKTPEIVSSGDESPTPRRGNRSRSASRLPAPPIIDNDVTVKPQKPKQTASSNQVLDTLHQIWGQQSAIQLPFLRLSQMPVEAAVGVAPPPEIFGRSLYRMTLGNTSQHAVDLPEKVPISPLVAMLVRAHEGLANKTPSSSITSDAVRQRVMRDYSVTVRTLLRL